MSRGWTFLRGLQLRERSSLRILHNFVQNLFTNKMGISSINENICSCITFFSLFLLTSLTATILLTFSHGTQGKGGLPLLCCYFVLHFSRSCLTYCVARPTVPFSNIAWISCLFFSHGWRAPSSIVLVLSSRWAWGILALTMVRDQISFFCTIICFDKTLHVTTCQIIDTLGILFVWMDVPNPKNQMVVDSRVRRSSGY